MLFYKPEVKLVKFNNNLKLPNNQGGIKMLPVP